MRPSGVAAKLTQFRLLKSVDGLLLTEEDRHVAAAGLVKLNFFGPELPIISAEEGRQGEAGTRKWEMESLSFLNFKQ